MTECISLLLSGDMIAAMLCPLTNIIGAYTYALILFFIELVIFIKYDSLLAPSIIGIFLGTLMAGVLPPEINYLSILIIIANFTSILYALYTRRD